MAQFYRTISPLQYHVDRAWRAEIAERLSSSEKEVFPRVEQAQQGTRSWTPSPPHRPGCRWSVSVGRWVNSASVHSRPSPTGAGAAYRTHHAGSPPRRVRPSSTSWIASASSMPVRARSVPAAPSPISSRRFFFDLRPCFVDTPAYRLAKCLDLPSALFARQHRRTRRGTVWRGSCQSLAFARVARRSNGFERDA